MYIYIIIYLCTLAHLAKKPQKRSTCNIPIGRKGEREGEEGGEREFNVFVMMQYNDEELWSALERCHLKDRVTAMGKKSTMYMYVYAVCPFCE